MTVVFSTYQSIQVITDAQQKMACRNSTSSSAMKRTARPAQAAEGEDESNFVKVHDQNVIRGKKRLYMTATPRSSARQQSKAKARRASCCPTMDDEAYFGEDAVRPGLRLGGRERLLPITRSWCWRSMSRWSAAASSGSWPMEHIRTEARMTPPRLSAATRR